MYNIAQFVAARLSIDSERRVAAIRYGLFAVVIVVTVALIGQNMTNSFNTIFNKLP